MPIARLEGVTMAFIDRLKQLADRIPSLLEHLETEEATKNALVMPFISTLGYDVFNPTEVVPEFTADVGLKKGEKVDYAIFREGEIAMIIECKKAGSDLSKANMSQLLRYFNISSARIGVLTNGILYRFYTDMQESNIMDARPFLELDLLHLRDDLVNEVRKMGKAHFDLEEMLSAATELKFTSEITKALTAQLEQPEPEFVKFFFQKANPNGRFSKNVQDFYTGLVQRALNQFIRDRVSIRLKAALDQENNGKAETSPGPNEQEELVESEKPGIVTTEDEIEGFHTVKAIVRKVISADRVAHRDTKSYMGILVDDNNRKPICRLHFNAEQKYLGLFDEEKSETRHPINHLDDIYRFAEQLEQTAQRYI